MKNTTKKLSLRTHTLRALDAQPARALAAADLQAVVGGLGGDEVGIRHVWTYGCK